MPQATRKHPQQYPLGLHLRTPHSRSERQHRGRPRRLDFIDTLGPAESLDDEREAARSLLASRIFWLGGICSAGITVAICWAVIRHL